MVKVGQNRNYRKTFHTPRRPYEKERLDQELKLCGEYGLRCKREIWRAARELLTLPETDTRRIFEGSALIRRLIRLGLLSEEQKKLDYVLQLSTQKILDRRLQTIVHKNGLARSIHHARCLIKQRHIAVGNQIVNVPSFAVNLESEKQIKFANKSPFGNGKPGRLYKKKHPNE